MKFVICLVSGNQMKSASDRISPRKKSCMPKIYRYQQTIHHFGCSTERYQIAHIFNYLQFACQFSAAKGYASTHLLLSSQIWFYATQTPSRNIHLFTFFVEMKILGSTDLIIIQNLCFSKLNSKLFQICNFSVQSIQSQMASFHISNWKTIHFIERW